MAAILMLSPKSAIRWLTSPPYARIPNVGIGLKMLGTPVLEFRKLIGLFSVHTLEGGGG